MTTTARPESSDADAHRSTGEQAPDEPAAGEHTTADGQGAPQEDRHGEDLTPERAFENTVEEGRRRMDRPLSALLATGVVGGLDVATGVLALLLVEHYTGSKMLGALAFGVGFIAITLAQSELFTEGFLLPIVAVTARKARMRDLWRLWVVTGVANLVGGWVVAGLIAGGLPELRKTAVDISLFYAELGVSWRAFALALLGGMVITLMTWMQHTSEQVGPKLVAAVGAAFVLAAGSLNHAIIDSIIMFTALHTGAPFGYGDWLVTFAWATLGNIIGGVGLVTAFRLLQVPQRVAEERRHDET